MSELLGVSFSFPTVLFSFAFIVVVIFWLVVLVGAVGSDLLDIDTDTEIGSSGGITSLLPVVRSSRGVPVTVVLSVWIVFAWFGCVLGMSVLNEFGIDGLVRTLLSVVLLVVAPTVGWVATLLVVLPLGRLIGKDQAQSNQDFVGKTCLIRTQTVDTGFGQAEITSADGSSALIQVRRPEHGEPVEGLTAGTTALIFEYDKKAEVFFVAPFDLSVNPEQPAH